MFLSALEAKPYQAYQPLMSAHTLSTQPPGAPVGHRILSHHQPQTTLSNSVRVQRLHLHRRMLTLHRGFHSIPLTSIPRTIIIKPPVSQRLHILAGRDGSLAHLRTGLIIGISPILCRHGRLALQPTLNCCDGMGSARKMLALKSPLSATFAPSINLSTKPVMSRS